MGELNAVGERGTLSTDRVDLSDDEHDNSVNHTKIALPRFEVMAFSLYFEVCCVKFTRKARRRLGENDG